MIKNNVVHFKANISALFIGALSLPVYAQSGDTALVTPVPAQSDLCAVAPVRFSSEQLMPPEQIKVKAQEAEIIGTAKAEFKGDVNIVSDSAIISAQEAKLENATKTLKATGQVGYQDEQLLVQSDAIEISSSKESLTMDNTIYQLTGFVGHGAAERIKLNTNDGLVLEDVTFTTCPIGEEDWSLQASEISIANGSSLGEAYHTRFYVGDVPVLYLPYFAFPVSNERQTGLLFPQISSSSSTGIDIKQPFYWNIAPNYDMLITPRMMSNRGVQLQTEFRYLTKTGNGQLNFEYLPSDDDQAGNPSRYFYRYVHQGELSDNWMLNVDFNGLSDDNYIVDLNSDFYNRADTHLYRTIGLDYYSDNLDFSLYMRDFETIGDHPDIYRALPEAKLNYHEALGRYFTFNIDSELAYFESANEANPTAMRWHVAPTIALPYQRHWGELTAEVSLLNTYYQQDKVEGTELKESVNRTLGQGRLFGTLYFEREQHWFDQDTTMTFEPKVQYLYTSYEDQSDIGLYDTTALLTDVNGLFRGREFTGLDRISDNNQITLGMTSRIIDDNNREQFVLSLGQIFYLTDNKVTAATKSTDRSALAAELDWRLSSRMFVHTDVQITTETDKVERSSVTFEYRHNANSLVQLTHRYVRDLSGEVIDQAGVSVSWPLTNNWHFVGRSYRDLERDRSIENYFGLQYESCCWAIRVVAQRQLSNRYGDDMQNTDEFDSGISLQFIFKGIGTKSSNRDMLVDGMFGYRQPYILN